MPRSPRSKQHFFKRRDMQPVWSMENGQESGAKYNWDRVRGWRGLQGLDAGSSAPWETVGTFFDGRRASLKLGSFIGHALGRTALVTFIFIRIFLILASWKGWGVLCPLIQHQYGEDGTFGICYVLHPTLIISFIHINSIPLAREEFKKNHVTEFALMRLETCLLSFWDRLFRGFFWGDEHVLK